MVGLVDCNSFYVSCERLFRPELEGKPVIVLSNNDGCAISISDEAKALGVKMAAPVHLVKELLEKNNVIAFSSNYTFYGDMSARVMDTISPFAPRMEVYSIDETFLDLAGIPFQQLEGLAVKIRNTVRQHTGIPVSIGIAPTKTLAKMANRFAKKTKKEIGVHVMRTKEEIHSVLHKTEIGDVWGIGAQHEQRLRKINVNSAFDFTLLPTEWVRKNMTVTGLRMLKEMQGTCCIEWVFTKPVRKNIGTHRSFGSVITNKNDLAEAVSNFAANCTLKLRNDKSCAQYVHVQIQTNPFRYKDKQFFRSIKMRLAVPTDDSREIIKQALRGLELIYCDGYNYMKAGVMLTDLVSSSEIQQGVFEQSDRRRSKKIMHALDRINNIFGKNTVRIAAQGYEKRWRLKAAKLSPCYTTDISKLPKLKCDV